MKGVTGFLVGAVVLAIVGAACLGARAIEREVARVQQDFATFKYDEPEATFDTAERYFEYASRFPGFGNGPLNDVRARRATLRYWQNQYDDLVPKQSDPVTAIPADNVDLQLVVAHAVYRSGQARSIDKPTTLEALDAAIAGYLTVLRNAPGQNDAAYNYEYLVRLRDEVEKARRFPGSSPSTPDEGSPAKSPAGEPGGQPATREAPQFKIYIPLESNERDDGLAGKAGQIKRKG